MPQMRIKLLPGSKILIRQKLWFRFWFFGWKEFKKTYLHLRTPINKLKEQSLALETKLMRVRTEIQIMEKDYDATVKHMGTLKRHDQDGGAVTQWKFEALPWYKFSIFQWAIAFIDEPPAFDPKLYRFGGNNRQPAKRDKDFEVYVNEAGKDAVNFRKEMEQAADPEGKKITRVAEFTPGDNNAQSVRQNKGESQADFNKRKEAAKGKLTGMDDEPGS